MKFGEGRSLSAQLPRDRIKVDLVGIKKRYDGSKLFPFTYLLAPS